MKEEQNLNKIAKYLSDNMDSEEREDLFAWVKETPENKTLLEDSMEVWEVSSSEELDFQPNIDAGWEKMDTRLTNARNNSKKTTTVRRLAFFRPWMRIAAAAIILLGVAFWMFSSENGNPVTEQTFAQEKTTIELPDGSKIWLNQNSTLKYEEDFKKRIVFLEGEAFFDVAKMKDSPFEIFAGASKTTVLGTSFNIRAYPEENDVEISVESGKVDFAAESKASENALLTKGDFATYTKSNQKVQKWDIAKLNAAAWQKGALRFNNSQLEDVIESLERYYDIEIEVSNNNIYKCIWNNTKTYEAPDLRELIQILEYTNDLNITTKDNQIFNFSGEGCK